MYDENDAIVEKIVIPKTSQFKFSQEYFAFVFIKKMVLWMSHLQIRHSSILSVSRLRVLHVFYFLPFEDDVLPHMFDPLPIS